MLLWISLLVLIALVLGASACALMMSRAERRARRNLYRSLGLTETTVEFLMERNRDVLTELTHVRRQGEAADTKVAGSVSQPDRNVIFLRPGLRANRQASGAPTTGESPAPSTDRPTDGRTRP